jgi:ParB family chromosome partitioning protein
MLEFFNANFIAFCENCVNLFDRNLDMTTSLRITVLPIDQIERGRYQPRKVFQQEELQELADSIQSCGLLQPIVVRPSGHQRYEIIAGERRWRACQLAGQSEIPCIIKHYSDEQAAEASLIENIIRVDLNPIEVAKSYQRLIDEFAYLHEEVAAAVGKSRVKVTNALRLLKLDKLLQDMVIEGRLSEGHAKILAALPYEEQRELAEKCLARGWSVRKMEQEVKKIGDEKHLNHLKKDVNFTYLERAISQKIGCRTRVEFTEDKGQLSIQFSNLDVLDGILKKLQIDLNQLDNY